MENWMEASIVMGIQYMSKTTSKNAIEKIGIVSGTWVGDGTRY